MSKKTLNVGVLIFRDTSVNGVPVFGVNKAYLEYASRFGNVEFVNSHSNQVRKDIDILILPGGEDVSSITYSSGAPSYYQQRPNPHATWWYENMFSKYIDQDIPILGICMGMQASILNTERSTITQHIKLPISMPRGETIDTLVDSSGKEMFPVNSIHHQAFFPDQINQDIWQIVAVSKEFGNVEMVKDYSDRILLVQYHPEEMGCDNTELIFKDMVDRFYKRTNKPDEISKILGTYAS